MNGSKLEIILAANRDIESLLEVVRIALGTEASINDSVIDDALTSLKAIIDMLSINNERLDKAILELSA